MAIKASNSEIIKSARRITTNPSVVSVKALKFNKKADYSKFIKWIDSSTKELEKIKLPKKKDIKGISVKGSGGIGLLGLAAILGVGGLIASGTLSKMLKKAFPGGDDEEKKGPPGSGTIQNVAKGVIGGSAIRLASKTPMGKTAIKTAASTVTKNRWLNRFFNPMNKAKNNIRPFNRVASTTARKVTTKGIGKGIVKNLPGIRTVFGLGSAVYRASQGDFVGAGLSLGSAIPGPVGWGFVAADIGRDFMPKDGSIDVKKKSNDVKKKSNIAFSNSMKKFENVVGEFESIKFVGEGEDKKSGGRSRKKWWNPFTWIGNNNKSEPNLMREVYQIHQIPPTVIPDIKGDLGVKLKEDISIFETKLTSAQEKKKQYILDGDRKREYAIGKWIDFYEKVIPFKRKELKVTEDGEKNINKVISKENKVSNVNFKKDQVIVMVPQGMESPSGGGIVPIPIPTGGGGNGNIIMNNSADDVNTIATNLLLTKLSV